MKINSVPCQHPNNKLFGRKRTKPEFAFIGCLYVFCKKNCLVIYVFVIVHYSGKLMFLSLHIFTFSITYCSRFVEIEYLNKYGSAKLFSFRVDLAAGYTVWYINICKVGKISKMTCILKYNK